MCFLPKLACTQTLKYMKVKHFFKVQVASQGQFTIIVVHHDDLYVYITVMNTCNTINHMHTHTP